MISHNELKIKILFRCFSLSIGTLFGDKIFIYTKKIGRKDNFSRPPAVIPERCDKYYDKYYVNYQDNYLDRYDD